MKKSSTTLTDDALFESLARRYLLVDTLTLRGRDHLDFHSVSVTAIRKALAAAYEAGRAAGGSPPPAPNTTDD